METIGDAYMVVSGAPDVTKYHAMHIADLSFGMIECMPDIKDPRTSEPLKIRIGKHLELG